MFYPKALPLSGTFLRILAFSDKNTLSLSLKEKLLPVKKKSMESAIHGEKRVRFFSHICSCRDDITKCFFVIPNPESIRGEILML
jgi:hypothetical protein